MGKHSSDEESDEGAGAGVDKMSVDSSSDEEELRPRRKSKKSKSSAGHKKKKSKDKKKHKKRSKKMKKRSRSSSSEEDSSASDEADEWVVKAQPKPESGLPFDDVKETEAAPKRSKPEAVVGTRVPTAEEDDQWTTFANAMPTVSTEAKKAERRRQKERDREQSSIDNSLEKILTMLEEAESKVKDIEKSRERDNRSRFRRPDRDSDDEGFRRDTEYSSRRRPHERHRGRRSRSRDRHRNKESSSGWRKRRDSPERSKRKDSPERSRRNDFPERSKRHDSPERSYKKTRSPEPVAKNHLSPPVATREREGETREKSFAVPSSSNAGSHSVPSDDEPEDIDQVQEVPKPLTDKDMNELGAKLLKAEMLGNTTLMEELKKKIADAETTRQEYIKNGGQSGIRPTKVVTKILMEPSRGRKNRDKITETHKDGQRVRYFPDDDKQTLKNMNAKTGVDYDADDVFTDKASSSKQVAKDQEREVRDALEAEKQYNKVIDNCRWCFDGSVVEKHLILSVAEKCYLCVPPYQSLSEGHCLIIPMSHVSSATELDEDVWAEMQKFRKALVKMFRELDQDIVIFETALFLKRHPHMYLECVPMPRETGELAPTYFKKAIQECETEWSQNKKLVDLRNRGVRRAVPKGLPYFSVDFGDDSCGFAHVVEDERAFPKNFAHEIVGGMMELDHHLWRKQKNDDFKTQRNKVMEFLKHWGPFDWTRDPS